ncbi:MAG: energy-coupling factor transporter transmembrane protein EcfT [Anaerolineae bacterium]|nr:energy-coupling factor transporter transmembrane protein EcfT [Anaerolineae bacterium]
MMNDVLRFTSIKKHRIAYTPAESWLHQLHPLVKLAWMVTGTVGVFVTRIPWVVLGVVTAAICAFPLSKLSLHHTRGWWMLITMTLLLGGLQVIFNHTGEIVFTLGPLNVYRSGLEAGIYVAGRFLSVVLLSYLFVLTTDPNALAYALMQVGLPYRYGFAFITALRLVPVFEEEAHIVYQAQLARGVEYDSRSPRRFVRLAHQFFLPMLVSALGKVDALAVSMEGRCFGKYPDRTYLRETRFCRWDYISLGVLGGIIITFCIIRQT